MIRIIKSTMLMCVMLPLVSVSPAIAAHHESVLQVVAVDGKPGTLDDYPKQLNKLTGYSTEG